MFGAAQKIYRRFDGISILDADRTKMQMESGMTGLLCNKKQYV